MRPDPPMLERVRSIAEAHLAGLPVEIYLFGSWARGAARRTSDIDLGVLPRGEVAPRVFADLREAFEESSIPYPVEVVDLREVSPDFLARVLREGIRWSA